jgi:predicted small lipoprotein YifL
MKPYKLLLLFLLLNTGLTGCGQPGPLYLPNQAAPIHVQPAPEPESKPKNTE